ncbi:amino acid ABC transporter ATP-binding protein [Alloiococcus otitis]|uniref:amino acid ABC transporter ATP-binding protein n=1 Tax=Alloiococcus otitis TaxID=1652 RepID=UPI0023527D1E|nr:amino acid ABC transporter ATP-binding protein [Alloiococcus otitis]
MTENVVTIENLSKSFGNHTVLQDINLEVKDKEIVAIIGPSGTGKSTFLRTLNYLNEPTSGKITIGDVTVDAKSHSKKDVQKLRLQSSMVFQHYNLFKNMTALENVMESLITVRKLDKDQAKSIAIEQLEKVGMAKRQDAYPSELSGGQQQRVGIARSLAVNPKVFLFDEPTSALDPMLVSEVLATIQGLVEEGNTTMLLVTHEISFARKVANRVLFMNQGRIAADGSPEEILDNPTDTDLRKFLDTSYY